MVGCSRIIRRTGTHRSHCRVTPVATADHHRGDTDLIGTSPCADAMLALDLAQQAIAMGSPSERAQHLNSVEDVLTLFEAEVAARELKKYFRLEGIDYVWTAGGTIVPSPISPFSSPYLYRGQPARYQPCLPSAFRRYGLTDHPRKLSRADRARCFVDRVKLEEFVLALDAHPASAYGREIGLRMHPYALAQHYELPTDRIDLTQDHKVAAFFATNTRKDGVWSPVTTGVGVIYRLHWKAFHGHFRDRLECIGKQVLPRPGEQKAHTLVLALGEDFESLPVERYTFFQQESCGRRLNDHFNGGVALFPPDVMGEIANAIKSDTSLPHRIVTSLMEGDAPFRDLIADERDVGTAFAEHGIHFHVSTRDPIGLTTSQRATAAASVEGIRSTFLDNVGVLAVRGYESDPVAAPGRVPCSAPGGQ